MTGESKFRGVIGDYDTGGSVYYCRVGTLVLLNGLLHRWNEFSSWMHYLFSSIV